MPKIYVVGNRLLKADSLPLRIMGALAAKFPAIDFVEFDPTENFPEEKSIVIIDTVVGLKKVELLEDIGSFSLPKPYSLHDFDLGLTLKLMQKAGLLEKFKIIGVPPELTEKEAAMQVAQVIRPMSL